MEDTAALNILFADDEPSLREIMRNEIPRMGHSVTICADGRAAVTALEECEFDCLVVDLDMPELSGIEVIAKAKELCPDADAVVLTGKSSLETAIAALRYGAYDYLTKPCRLKELESLFQRVAEKRLLKKMCRALQLRVRRLEGKTEIIGTSLQSVRDRIAIVAPTDSTVLILGETGTGKELVARSLHECSLRAKCPFVAVNAGELSESLIESELFGHKRGAFSGANEHREGLIEAASSGTLFLDEIGDLPLSMHVKLLRVLESGECRRVGENNVRRVDVRLICATHRDLEMMVAQRQFRQDLFYRINAFELRIPPLRERISDIPDLAEHLIARFRAIDVVEEGLTWEVVDSLCNYTWPGNVRELANVIEHALIMSGGQTISTEHLPDRLRNRPSKVIVQRDDPLDWLEANMCSLQGLRASAIDKIRACTIRPNGQYRLQRNEGRKTAVVSRSIFELLRNDNESTLDTDVLNHECDRLANEIGLQTGASVRNWLGFHLPQFARTGR